MTSQNETEITINNKQDFDNVLNINNNQTKNVQKNIILNINQTEPNLKINNIYGNYNISKDNLPKNFIDNNYYPNTEDTRISKELKNVKSNQIINEKNNEDNSLDKSIPLQKNDKSIELPPKINQNDDKVTVKEKYLDPSDNKDNKKCNKKCNIKCNKKCNKKCKKCCCKILHIILKLLVYILLFILYLFLLIFSLITLRKLELCDDFDDCINIAENLKRTFEEVCEICRDKCKCCDKCCKFIFGDKK